MDFLSLNDGRKELYQWDSGRMATVAVKCDIVHFSNLKYGESLAVEVKEGNVAIPNKLLMSGAEIYCWAFAKDESGAYTKQEQTFNVIKRPKPSDYCYTETEVITIQKAVEDALQEAKESGDFKGEKGDKGEKGEDANAQEIISYSNETFANALKGSKIGGIVSISDISPIQHMLGVRVRSEDLNSPIPEISAVKVKKLGKNLFNNDTSTIDAVTYVNFRGESNTDFGYELHLPAGKYTVSAKFVDNPIFESIYIYTYINNKNGEFVPFSEAFKNVDGSNKRDQYIITETVVHKPFIYNVKEGDVIYIIDAVSNDINYSKQCFDSIQIQIEQGTIVTEYEPYIEPTEYAVNADGAVDGVSSIYPATTLMTDASGVVLNVEYNRDINKAFEKLYSAIISIGGNV